MLLKPMRSFCISFTILLASLISRPSFAYSFRAIIEQNPELVEKFESYSKHKSLRKTTIAVVGDYIHVEAFKEVLDTNLLENPMNGQDDDLNGYVDDYYGVDITTKNGALLGPKLSGHENGIVSLLHALIKELHLESAVSLIPISIELSKRTFDDLTMKKLADAIDYARLRGAKIVSLSLGISHRYHSFFNFIDNDYQRSMNYLQAAIERAKNEGVIILGANSNDPNRDHALEPQVPANLDHVISVANVDYLGEIISGYGENTDIAFYGTDLFVWDGEDFGHAIQRGSSYATPLVAFALAATNSFSDQEIEHNKQFSKRLKKACEFSIKTQRNISSRCVFSPSVFLNSYL